MALREWLIILGLLLLAVIIIDGVRRFRRQKQVPQLNQSDPALDFDPEEKTKKRLAWELPNGGARVIKSARVEKPSHQSSTFERRGMKTRISADELEESHENASVEFKENLSSHFEDEIFSEKESSRLQLKEEASLSETASVAVLEEKVADSRYQGLSDLLRRRTSTVTTASEQTEEVAKKTVNESFFGHTDLFNETNDPLFKTKVDEGAIAKTSFQSAVPSYQLPHGDERFPSDETDEFQNAIHPLIEAALAESIDSIYPKETLSQAQDWLIIHAIALTSEPFQGLDLLRFLLACNLKYDKRSKLFHRFETASIDSPLQFSVVNSLKPGQFELNEFENFSTKGLTFIQPMPAAEDLRQAFAAMFETARALIRNLNGELRDEQHSALTAQTIAFNRRRVQEFERRQHLYSSLR